MGYTRNFSHNKNTQQHAASSPIRGANNNIIIHKIISQLCVLGMSFLFESPQTDCNNHHK